MTKRTVKPYNFEAETERTPLTPALEHRLRKVAIAGAPVALGEWNSASEDADRFYSAPKASMAAVVLGQYMLARVVAVEGLRLAPQFRENWNFGNAQHFCHTALGLVALAEGDEGGALAHLRQSGETPGSPQLGTFGPSMRLARDLLRRGYREEVLVFVRQCRSFWDMGARWLDIWEKKVQRGAMPVFFMNLYR